MRVLTEGAAFGTDPLQISNETLNIILFILTDALNMHMAFVCIGTLFSRHTYTHSVRQIQNKPSDPYITSLVGGGQSHSCYSAETDHSSVGLKSVWST